MAGKGQLTREEERGTVGVSVQGHLFRSGTDVKFYDLAGQVEYYGLHQLFLTETALYVLVWDASKYRNRTEVCTLLGNISVYESNRLTHVVVLILYALDVLIWLMLGYVSSHFSPSEK